MSTSQTGRNLMQDMLASHPETLTQRGGEVLLAAIVDGTIELSPLHHGLIANNFEAGGYFPLTLSGGLQEAVLDPESKLVNEALLGTLCRRFLFPQADIDMVALVSIKDIKSYARQAGLHTLQRMTRNNLDILFISDLPISDDPAVAPRYLEILGPKALTNRSSLEIVCQNGSGEYSNLPAVVSSPWGDRVLLASFENYDEEQWIAYSDYEKLHRLSKSILYITSFMAYLPPDHNFPEIDRGVKSLIEKFIESPDKSSADIMMRILALQMKSYIINPKQFLTAALRLKVISDGESVYSDHTLPPYQNSYIKFLDAVVGRDKVDEVFKLIDIYYPSELMLRLKDELRGVKA